MWAILMTQKYNDVVNTLLFDTKEEAEAQAAILAPFLGKDKYDFQKNGETEVVNLTDKFGTIKVIAESVTTVRCYDQDAWDTMAIEKRIKLKTLEKEAGVADIKLDRLD